MESIFKAIVLGVVEGITEFLPVSSTGHLILVGHWLQFNGSKAASFDVFIQLGAILALLCLFRERFSKLFVKASDGGFSGWRGWALLAVGTGPAMVAGLLFHGAIKEYLFDPRPVAIGLMVGGLAMLGVEFRGGASKVDSVDDLTWRLALGVGLFQCLALWPGISRSAATMVGGMLLGLNRRVAAEFSFLLAVPLMTMAAVFDLVKSAGELGRMDMAFFAVGFVVAFGTAWTTVAWLLRFISRHTFVVFGGYRIAVAALVLYLTAR